MNKLPMAKRVAVISALVEGNSLRSTVRMTGVALNTIQKLLKDVGEASVKMHDKRVHSLTCNRIQIDEIWQFCYAKEKNVPKDKKGQFGYGDVWTWTAIDAQTKLIVSYMVGPREQWVAQELMEDIQGRITNRPQITTDGLKAYRHVIEKTFGIDVDYAVLKKNYGGSEGSEASAANGRYSPREVVSITKEVIRGNPDMKHVSTSYVERNNLTMRMSMRRFTRLTNAFSKKVENHANAICLHFAYYNFCRVHKTLRVTPAMEAGLTDHVWGIEELIATLVG